MELPHAYVLMEVEACCFTQERTAFTDALSGEVRHPFR